jgi:hypothetical protein
MLPVPGEGDWDGASATGVALERANGGVSADFNRRRSADDTFSHEATLPRDQQRCAQWRRQPPFVS